MTHSVVVKSSGSYGDLSDKIKWCYEQDIFSLDYDWVFDEYGMVETVEFRFKTSAEASLFALRWV